MKRIISFVLCLSMLLSMTPVSAFAAEVDESIPVETVQAAVTEAAAEVPAETDPAETEEVTTAPETTVPTTASTEAPQETTAAAEEPAETTQATEVPETTGEETVTTTEYTWVPDEELPSDEELFAAYAEGVLYGNGTSLLGTAAGDSLTGNVKAAYDALVPLLKQIASGERASAVISVGHNLGTAPDVEADITGDSFSQDEIDTLLQALLNDLPYELYWFDKTETGGVKALYSWSSSKMYIEFSFAVSADYSATKKTGTYDADTSLTGAATTSAANAKAIVEEYEGQSDYEKLTAYRAEIRSLTDYNHDAVNNAASYGDPWQLIWVFDGDSTTKVVCEGYSKAFQYLCDLSDFDADITCYSVIGTMDGGDHMWNIVRINGSGYLVDVTNDTNGKLFLVGSTPDSSGAYTFNSLKFVYGDEAKTLWGTGEDSILTLATEDFDPDSLSSSQDEADSTANSCGENLTWSFDEENGVLTISGTGDMYDYDAGNSPWAGYESQILSIVIEEGVASVGNLAFMNCTEATTLTVPDSLTSIGECAFMSTGITEIVLPGCVTSIGLCAFSDCSNLTSFTILDSEDTSAETVFEGTYSCFTNCSNLKTVTLGNTVKNIPANMFMECAALTNVTVSDSLVSIGECAFMYTGIMEIVLPGSVTSIGECAFGSCSDLTSFTILDSKDSSAETVLDYPFARCYNLKTIVLGNTVKNIPTQMFIDCPALTNVNVSDSLVSIGESAFMYTGITEIVLPGSVTSIGENAFGSCSNLERFEIKDAENTDTETVFEAGISCFEECDNLKTVVLGNTVKNIPDEAFLYRTALTNVTLSNSLVSIGDNAFGSCSSLEEIVIPANVTSIGEGAFAFSGLTKITFYGDAPSIADYSFSDVTCTAHYPAENSTWTEDVLLDYGGEITWLPIGAISQEAFAAALESCEGYYVLSDTVEISEDMTLPEVRVEVDGGAIIVNEGVTLTNNGGVVIQDGGAVTVNGTLVNDGWYLDVESGGSLVVNGTFTGSDICINGGSLTNNGTLDISQVHVGVMTLDDITLAGVAEDQIHYTVTPTTTDELIAALALVEEYNPWIGIEQDLTINKDVTIPDGANVAFENVTLTVASGATLTLDGELTVRPNSALVVAEGGKLVNNVNLDINNYSSHENGAVVTIDGELVSYGTIWVSNGGSLNINGTAEVYNGIHAGFGENGLTCPVNVSGSLTTYGYLNIVEVTGELNIAEGGTVTVGGMLFDDEGNAYTNGYLQAAGTITVDGTLNVSGGFTLGSESGSEMTVGTTGALNISNDCMWFDVGEGAVLSNEGTVTNNGILNDWGTIANYASFTNNGQIRLFGTGTYDDYGDAALVGNEPVDGPTAQMDDFKNDLKDGSGANLYDSITLTEDLTIDLGQDEDGNDNLLFINSWAELHVPAGVTLTVNSAVFVNDGAIVVEDGGVLNINSNVQLNSGEAQMGHLIVLEGGTVNVNDGGTIWVDNGGLLEVNGTANVLDDPATADAGAAVHVGFFTEAGGARGNVSIYGTMSTSGYVNVTPQGWFTLQEGGVLNILNTEEYGCGYLDVTGMVQLYGTVYQDGLMSVANGNENGAYADGTARIEIYGTLTASDTSGTYIYSNASISVTGTLETAGEVMVKQDGTLWVDGDVTFYGPAPVTNYGSIQVNFFTSDSGNDATLTIDGEVTNYGYLPVNPGGTLIVNGTLTIGQTLVDELGFAGYLNGFGYVEINDGGVINNYSLMDIDSPDGSGYVRINEGGTLNVENNIIMSVCALGTLYVDGTLNIADTAFIEVRGNVEGSGVWNNDGLAHFRYYTEDDIEKAGGDGAAQCNFSGEYNHGEYATVEVTLFEGEPIYVDLIPTEMQSLVSVDQGIEEIRIVLSHEDYQPCVIIQNDVTLDEDLVIGSNGYVLISQGGSLTIPEGVTLTAYGPINLYNGQLNVDGTLKLYHPNGTLDIGEAATATVNGTVFNGTSTMVYGSLVIDGTWEGYMPTVMDNGTVTGAGAPTEMDMFLALVQGAEANGYEAHLTFDVTLDADVELNCYLVIDEGATLTVPRGVTLTANNVVDVYGTLTVKSGGKLVNNNMMCAYPSGTISCASTSCYSGDGDVQASYENGTLATIKNIAKSKQTLCYANIETEEELLAGLALAASDKYKDALMLPYGSITLTKDLTIPENVTYAPIHADAVFTIPEGVTLTNYGGIQAGPTMTTVINGTVENYGCLFAHAEGGMELNGVVNNYGDLISNGTLTQSGVICNYGGNVYINGELDVQDGYAWNFMVDGSYGSFDNYPADCLYLHCYPESAADINTMVAEFESGKYRDGTAQIDSDHVKNFVIDEDVYLVDGTAIMILDSEGYGPVTVTIAEGVTVSIGSGSCVITVRDGCELINNGFLWNEGHLNVLEGATLTNNGAIECAAGTGSTTYFLGTYTGTGGLNAQYDVGTGEVAEIGGNITPEQLYLSCYNITESDQIQEVIDFGQEGGYGSIYIHIIAQDVTLENDLTIPENVTLRTIMSNEVPATLTVPEGVTVNNLGTVQVTGGTTLVIDGTWEGNSPWGDGTISGSYNRPVIGVVTTTEPSFLENAGTEQQTMGLWAGSKLSFYPTLYRSYDGLELDASAVTIGYSEDWEDLVSISTSKGITTITANSNLAAHAVLTVTFSAEGAEDVTMTLQLRPKLTATGIYLNREDVTNQTVLADLGRGDAEFQLDFLAEPYEAYPEGGTLYNGDPLVTWKSSDTAIADVDENGIVTLTGTKTGKVKFTVSVNCGAKKTAVVTFNVVDLPQNILPSESNVTALIGGSAGTYTVYDGDTGEALKSSAVKWYLCDENGTAIETHPYASITTAGKLSTKAVADETKVYLMAQVIGDEKSATLAEPLVVTLYPSISTVEILDVVGQTINGKTLLYDNTVHGLTYQLSCQVGPEQGSVQDITWTSSKESVASIDENGLITVASEDASGTVKFTLTVVDLNNKKTTAYFQMTFGIFTTSMDLSATTPDGETVDLTAGEDSGLWCFGGESITFSATCNPSNVTTSGVTWSVTDKTAGSISSKGVLKTKSVANPTTITVYVQSKDGYCGYYIDVTVLPKAGSLYIMRDDTYEYITKTTQTIEPGETLSLSAFGSDDTVTWTSKSTAVADFDPETGLLVAKAKGSTTITAKSGSLSATFTLKVADLSEYVVISTKKGGPFTVASGKSLDLTATVYYSEDEDSATDTKVTWSVDEDDTSLATISSSGKLTAVKGLTKAASVTVIATAKDGCSYIWEDVEILPAATALEIYGPFGTGIVDVTNTTQKWDMSDGTTISLSAVVFPYDAMQDVKWTTSSSKIATVDENNGTVTLVGSGTVTITATAADGSGKKASFKLTVYKTMRYLELPDTAIIAGGKSLTITKLDGYNIDTLATNQTLNWTVDGPGAAYVSSIAKGVLKTKAVTAPTTVTVTAEATDGSPCGDSCEVTIYPATTAVTITNAPTQMYVHGEVDLDASVAPDTSAGAVTWTSSNEKIATVDENGVVTAGGTTGTVTITATAADGTGKKATAKIKVAAIPFTVNVEHDDGTVDTFTYTSTQATLVEALAEKGLIETEVDSYGDLSITSVNGYVNPSSTQWAVEYEDNHSWDYAEIPLLPNVTYTFCLDHF